MPIYTVAVVYRDGNPRDVSEHGTDLAAALRAKVEYERGSSRHHEHWMVYDADDPERGYFDIEDWPARCGGVVEAIGWLDANIAAEQVRDRELARR
jgi:hypothetical protein